MDVIEPKTNSRSDSAQQRAVQQKTVLVVDDEELVLQVTEAVLQQIGVRVLVAASGEQAMRVLEQRGGDVDLVILDMRLPGIAGLDLLRLARTRWPNVRALLVTGLVGADTVGTTEESGLVGVLSKPYEIDELTSAVQRALRQS